jgi:hypothetical protein
LSWEGLRLREGKHLEVAILAGIGLLGFLIPARFRPIGIPILLAIWIPMACVVIGTLINFNVIPFLVFGTAFWAAIDSSKIRLKDYKTGISYGPVVIFLCFAFLWIVAFPWYLIVRHKIKAGTAILKMDKLPRNTPLEAPSTGS